MYIRSVPSLMLLYQMVSCSTLIYAFAKFYFLMSIIGFIKQVEFDHNKIYSSFALNNITSDVIFTTFDLKLDIYIYWSQRTKFSECCFKNIQSAMKAQSITVLIYKGCIARQYSIVMRPRQCWAHVDLVIQHLM